MQEHGNLLGDRDEQNSNGGRSYNEGQRSNSEGSPAHRSEVFDYSRENGGSVTLAENNQIYQDAQMDSRSGSEQHLDQNQDEDNPHDESNDSMFKDLGRDQMPSNPNLSEFQDAEGEAENSD